MPRRASATGKNVPNSGACQAKTTILSRSIIRKLTELSPKATIEKILTHIRQDGRFERLASVAESERPRVRAMLGALGEQLGGDPRTLQALQRSLSGVRPSAWGNQSQYPAGTEDFYIDLLFYHLRLRAFIAIDLKKGKFKPEYAGKLNFYCNVINDRLKHEADQPTIGLILCQTQDRLLAEYSFAGIDKPIGVSTYELTRALPQNIQSALPTVEQIETELGEPKHGTTNTASTGKRTKRREAH